MISELAMDALEACKSILIKEIYDDLQTSGGKVDLNVHFLDEFDGEPEVCTVKSVYIKDDIVFVDYLSYGGDIYSDSIELFTVDTVAEVLSEL